MNLANFIWIDLEKKNQNDFILHARTRFDHDNFVEAIEFDYLDFQIIEEDY